MIARLSGILDGSREDKAEEETWDRKRGEIIRGILIPKEGQSVARALEEDPC